MSNQVTERDEACPSRASDHVIEGRGRAGRAGVEVSAKPRDRGAGEVPGNTDVPRLHGHPEEAIRLRGAAV